MRDSLWKKWLPALIIPFTAMLLPTGSVAAQSENALPNMNIPGPSLPRNLPTSPSNPIYYRIHPYNLPDLCMSIVEKSVLDQTKNPPVPHYEWVPITHSCSTANYIANDEFEIVNYNDASEWDGKRTGEVVLKSKLLGGYCMENASEVGTFSGQDFLVDGCASVVPTNRYYFYVSVNAYGAVQIKSLTDNRCIERNGPEEIRALACGGVGNWMVERVG